MKWFKRILGFLICLQCIGLYSAMVRNIGLHFDGWNNALGRGVFMGVIGTLFLVFGGILIKSSLKD